VIESPTEFHVEYQTPDKHWWTWREFDTEDEARNAFRGVKTNATAKAWRILKVTTHTEVIDV
jgi:hypothetical protein